MPVLYYGNYVVLASENYTGCFVQNLLVSQPTDLLNLQNYTFTCKIVTEFIKCSVIKIHDIIKQII